MTVHAEYGLVGIGSMFNNVADKFGIFAGNGIAHSIWQIDGGRPRLDHFSDHAHEKIRIGAGSVFGGEFYVGGIARRAFHALHGHLHNLFRAFAQFVFHVDGGSGEKGVDARLSRVPDGFPNAVDVAAGAARQPGDFGIFYQSGNSLYGFKISLAGSGKTGFNTINAQHFQLVREAKLFLKVHGCAGALFPVTQCGVENADAIAHAMTSSGKTVKKVGTEFVEDPVPTL